MMYLTECQQKSTCKREETKKRQNEEDEIAIKAKQVIFSLLLPKNRHSHYKIIVVHACYKLYPYKPLDPVT